MSQFKETYTEKEIQDRINNLFINTTTTDNGINTSPVDTLHLNVATEQLSDRMDDPQAQEARALFKQPTSLPQNGGNPSQFVSHRNRYEKYRLPTVTELQRKVDAEQQKGGGVEVATEDSYHSLSSNFSEYRRFREKLLANKQAGGASHNIDTSNSTTTELESPYNLVGGNDDGVSTDSSLSLSATSEALQKNMVLSATTMSQSDNGLVVDQESSASSPSVMQLTDTEDNSVIDAQMFYNSESSSDFAFRKPEVQSRF